MISSDSIVDDLVDSQLETLNTIIASLYVTFVSVKKRLFKDIRTPCININEFIIHKIRNSDCANAYWVRRKTPESHIVYIELRNDVIKITNVVKRNHAFRSFENCTGFGIGDAPDNITSLPFTSDDFNTYVSAPNM